MTNRFYTGRQDKISINDYLMIMINKLLRETQWIIVNILVASPTYPRKSCAFLSARSKLVKIIDWSISSNTWFFWSSFKTEGRTPDRMTVVLE